MKKFVIVYVAEYHVNQIECSSMENAVAVRNVLKAEGYKLYPFTVDSHLNRIPTVDGIAEISA